MKREKVALIESAIVVAVSGTTQFSTRSSSGGQLQTRLRSPQALSIRDTGGQNLCCRVQAVGVEGLDAVSSEAEGRGAKVIPLNVSVANHSPLVAGAVPDFSDFMETVSFTSPQIPVYFNVSGEL